MELIATAVEAAAAMLRPTGDAWAVDPELEVDAARCQIPSLAQNLRQAMPDTEAEGESRRVVDSIAPSVARSMEASSVNPYLRKIHGAISRTGESARRAQARPGQHLG